MKKEPSDDLLTLISAVFSTGREPAQRVVREGVPGPDDLWGLIWSIIDLLLNFKEYWKY